MGSGIALQNAIKKYGEHAFIKEVIAESFTREDLWELEKQIVNDEVVRDPLSYNMAYGGKHYLHGLKQYDYEKFIEHQSNAGKVGAKKAYTLKSDEHKKEWHILGGKKSAAVQKESGNRPFYTGEAAVAGGKAAKGLLELWHPHATATNKNQKDYRVGDCVKAKPGSEKYEALRLQGWRTISEHRDRKSKCGDGS